MFLVALVRLPVDDYLAALDAFVRQFRPVRLAVLLAAAALSWWIYVPIHELAHVAGCLLGGGTVTRLDLDPIYGAAWLARVFPFVVVGSTYAGQLSGFDTRGSDATYLLTDLLPFALTVFAGVPALRLAPRLRPGWGSAVFGAALPVAFAPFVSLTGDYYEMGSIVVSRAVAWAAPGFDVARWRGDDLFKLAGALAATDGGTGDALGVGAACVVGLLLAFLTYAAGAVWADLLGLRRLPLPRPAPPI